MNSELIVSLSLRVLYTCRVKYKEIKKVLLSEDGSVHETRVTVRMTTISHTQYLLHFRYFS